MYVGEYRDLLRDGQGSYTFPGSFFLYSGGWRRGKMHGQGELTLGDGTSYEGEFHDGEIDGVGLKRWPDGSSYNGHFREGEMHGEGVYLSASGERYEGRWENNQRCGHGQLRYANGDFYSGIFAAHYPSGLGKMVYASTGHVYEGEWLAGVRCGNGLLQDASGDRLYEGHWSQDRRNGEGVGVLSCVNVDAASNEEGPTSLWYDGKWKDDKPEVQTTKIVVMMTTKQQGSRPATASENQDSLPKDELRELPAQLVVENKRLPTLAVVCMGQGEVQDSTSANAIRVMGEHGRLFRLRIFEGAVPTHNPGEKVDIVAGSAWQFVSSGLSASQEKLLQSSESAQLVPEQLSEKIPNGGEELTEQPTEARLDAVTATASAGAAVFQDLLLPATTLVGDYHLICESMTSDSLPPVLIPLSIK